MADQELSIKEIVFKAEEAGATKNNSLATIDLYM